jgi:transcriptional regulator
MMAAAAADSHGNAGHDDRDEVTDRRVLVRVLEMRNQGYSFRDIAAALAKQGISALSPECVKDILEAHHAQKRKE